MSGEPTGTIYRNIALDDDLVFYVTAITDTAESCSCHSSSAGARIYAPWGSSSASSGMTGAYAQATARYQMSEAEFVVEQNVVVVPTTPRSVRSGGSPSLASIPGASRQ